MLEHDDGRAAGVGARDLDRVLERLGAGVDEQRLLLRATARGDLGEAAAHVDVRLVHADDEALVEVAVHLLVDGGHGGRQTMPRVVASEAPGEVDVALPVDVPDAGAFGPVDHERRSRDPAGDVALFLLEKALAGSSFLKRHVQTISRRAQMCMAPRRARAAGLGPLG